MERKFDLSSLSRAVSHALRHEPWLYELELDEAGWVETGMLLSALRQERKAWSSLTEAHLAQMIAASGKKRHEMRDGRIRALYGHSTPQRLAKERAEPPAILYHGTSPEAVVHIQVSGLRPMGRQYVHLSVDVAMAEQVGRRQAEVPIILSVHAGKAYATGIAFYRGNDAVWLADLVPAQFIDEARR
jgi:putative RNA 2'-phosphotransferase